MDHPLPRFELGVAEHRSRTAMMAVMGKIKSAV
jgi:hypothetical protein